MYTLKRLNVVKQVDSEHEVNKLLEMGYVMVSKSEEKSEKTPSEYNQLLQEVEQLKQELERLKSEKNEQTGGEENGEFDDKQSDNGQSGKTEKAKNATRAGK